MDNYQKGDKLVVEVESVNNGFVKIKGIDSIMFNENAIDTFEYLDGDYINENYGSLQDEAYSEGIKSSFDLIKKLRYMDYDDKVIWFELLDDGKEKWLEIIERYSYEEIINILEKYENSSTIKKYTWNELYGKAEGAACGEPALKAKDNARYILTEIIKEIKGYDIDKCEIPEEEIEVFLENSDKQYLFDKDGNLQ